MNTTLRIPLFAAAAALVALTGCNKPADGEKPDETQITGKPSDPPVALKATWRPGWNYQFFVQSQQSADFGLGRMRGGAGGGNDSGMETTFKQDLSVTVTNGPKDGISLGMELQSLGVTVFMGNETVAHYDSAQQTASGQAEQLAPMLDKIVGGRFTCLLDDKGKLKDVEGIRELIEESTSGGGDQGNAGGGAGDRRGGGGRRGGMMGMMGTTMIQRALNDSYFRPLVEFPGAPEGPMRVGQSWTTEQDSSVMMVANITIVTTNTFRGWQYRDGHKCARIEVTGTITQAKKRSEAGGGAAAGGFDLLRMLGDLSFDDAVVTGTIWLDPKLEFPVEVSMSQNFKISGTMPNWAAGMAGPGGRPNRGANAGAAAAAAAAAAGAPSGERFSRPVSMSLLMKLRSATGP
jgi:hypothetical protein